MSDGYIQVQPDSTGKKVDNSELTVGANTVERQRIVLADSADAAGLAVVGRSDPGSKDYGVSIRQVPGGADANMTHELLLQILGKLDDLVSVLTLKE